MEAAPNSNTVPARESRADQYQLWFCIAATLIACLIYLVGAWNYPLEKQHDPNLHFRIVYELVEDGTFTGYAGVYYYGFIALALNAFISGGVLSEATAVQLSVVLVNSCCFFGFLAGVYRFGSQMSMKRSTAWVLVACCASLPVLQGQFRMVRPENFLLLASIWAFVWFFIYLREPKKRSSLLWCALILALAITQKISGIVVAATLFFFCLRHLRSLDEMKPLLALVLVTAVPTILSWVGHYAYTGQWFFQHNAKYYDVEEYAHTPEVDVFLRVNPLDAWQEPRRNAQRDSMANILMLDLYGDYWEYRYSLLKFAHPRVGDDFEDYLAYLKWRGRAGLVLSCVLVGVTAMALYFLMRRGGLKESQSQQYSLASCAGIILALIYLIAAAYTDNYSPKDFDLAKWEYIGWVLPFGFVPACFLLDCGAPPKVRHVASLIFGVLILGGLAQSIY